MIKLAGEFLLWILGLITGRKESSGEKLGRAEEQVSEGKADLTVINRANVAAKKMEEKPDARDPNDLDAR